MKSQQGTQLILYKDYTYCHYRLVENKGIDYWRCTAGRSKNCKGKLVLELNSKHVFVRHEHNHTPRKYYVHNGKYVRI